MNFLEKLYQFDKNKIDSTIDFIFDYFDDAFLNNNFQECDDILEKLDLNKIPIVLMISFLTITLAAKSKLKNRINFYKKVEEKIKEKEPEKLKDLLYGLE